jgi:hypothetical protein
MSVFERPVMLESSGARAFNFDPHARQDWGYRAHGRVIATSKAIIEHVSGKWPG